jgi:diguanylate cyclase (GGDEF)-like protein
MPTIDLRAVILLAGAMGALMAMVIWFLRRNYPPSVGGLGEWAAAPAIIFVSTLLFGMRGVLPPFLTVIVANALLVSGVVLFYLGSGHFYRVAIDWRPWLAGILGLVLAMVWFTYGHPDYGWRLMIVPGFMALVFARHALLVWRHGGSAFSARFVLVVLILETLILALRAASALATDASDLLQAGPIQSLYIASYTVTMLMLTVGLVLLAADRLRGELEHLATHDPLTGVLMRRALLAACEMELARCHRHDRDMALLMCDLDRFKAINDTHGHLVGDRVLIDFVTRTGALLRTPDRFGRYGGEEFVVLLPETDAAEALIVAERIRAARGDSTLPPNTVSIGVASYRVSDTRVEDLLERADAALYRAKANGRNRVESDGTAAAGAATENTAAAG